VDIPQSNTISISHLWAKYHLDKILAGSVPSMILFGHADKMFHSSGIAIPSNFTNWKYAARSSGLLSLIFTVPNEIYSNYYAVQEGRRTVGEAVLDSSLDIGIGFGSATAGMVLGAKIGIKIGLVVGSAVPGFGTAVGMLAGAMIGGTLGWGITEIKESFLS